MRLPTLFGLRADAEIGSWLSAILVTVFLSLHGALLPAQHSSLRAWGGWTFDTRGRDAFIVGIAANYDMSAVLTADGAIHANGSVFNTFNHVPPLPAGRRYVAMSVHSGGGAAVVDNGEIVVWGMVGHTTLPVPVFSPPPPLPAGVAYTDVATGTWSVYGHCVAMRSDGQVVAWGDNTVGQCNLPQMPLGVSVAKVVCWGGTTYLIRSDGYVDVVGSNMSGEHAIPSLPAGTGYVDIRPCPSFRLALRTDGEIVAWGDNTYGQCNVPPLPPGTVYTAMAGGFGHAHAVRSDHVIVSWGAQFDPAPTIDPGNPCVQLAGGYWHMLARFADGTVVGWGRNGFYQSQIPGLRWLQGSSPQPLWFRDVSQGSAHTLAVLSSGRVIGFGETGNSRTTPPSWFDQYTFRRAEAGGWHSAALTTAGELFLWGDNSLGQCSLPPAPAGVTYVDMDLSVTHSVAVRSDGQAVAFGSNTFGETVVPPLPTGMRYTGCAAAYGRTRLIRSDGRMVSFGSGIGPYNVATPPAGRRYLKVATGQFVTGILCNDGSVVAWRSDPARDRLPPVLPPGVYYVEVAAGDYHLILRRSDGLSELAGNITRQLDWTPALDPGTSYVQVSAGYNTVAARVGPTSTYVGFASGCAGSRPAARLVPADTPRIGNTLEVRLLDLPQHSAVVAFGWLRPAPVPLTPQGLLGCSWNISLDAAVFVVGQENEAVYRLPIPDWPGLIGLSFHNQAVVLDPGANAAGAVVSDAAQGVIGNW